MSAPALSPGSGATPLVTVVVLNWCAEEDTAECLRSLALSDYPAMRVLLVDNGSEDGSGERLHAAFPEVPYLQTGANLGFSGGNNRGVERALADGCDYVLVLNNDTTLEPDAVRLLVETAQAEPRVGAVGPKILYHEVPELTWFRGGYLSRARGMGYHVGEGEPDAEPDGGPVREVSFLTGCCLLVPASVAAMGPLFEEDFFVYVEDVDFSLRMLERGFRLLFDPRSTIYHKVPLKHEIPSPFQIHLGTRNRRRMARRRFGPVERLRFALFFYPTRLVHLARYLSRGDRVRARALWEGMTQP